MTELQDGVPFYLIAEGVNPGEGHTIHSYEWIVIDKSDNTAVFTSSAESPMLALGQGNYDVTLKVTNDCMAISSPAIQTIEVGLPPCATPLLFGLVVQEIAGDGFYHVGDDLLVESGGFDMRDGTSVPTNAEFLVNGQSEVWNTGGNGSAILQNVQHGIIELSLRIQNSCGEWSDPAYITLEILPYICPIPTITGISTN